MYDTTPCKSQCRIAAGLQGVKGATVQGMRTMVTSSGNRHKVLWTLHRSWNRTFELRARRYL